MPKRSCTMCNILFRSAFIWLQLFCPNHNSFITSLRYAHKFIRALPLNGLCLRKFMYLSQMGKKSHSNTNSVCIFWFILSLMQTWNNIQLYAHWDRIIRNKIDELMWLFRFLWTQFWSKLFTFQIRRNESFEIITWKVFAFNGRDWPLLKW